MLWVGDSAPDESDSKALWQAFGFRKHRNVLEAAKDLELFIAENPNSGWTPCLRSLLAKEYADTGRYTKALAHWEAAWEATSELSGNGKLVADRSLAHWTRLLASLGRTEQLSLLFDSNKNRRMAQQPLQVLYDETWEAFASLQKHPESSFGCGGYALSQLARTIGADNASQQRFLSTPMPKQG
jgi:tetratricopeptide (TPR) repeat protein